MANINRGSYITIVRATEDEISENFKEIIDGQIIFDTTNQQVYCDEVNKRVIYCGKPVKYITENTIDKEYKELTQEYIDNYWGEHGNQDGTIFVLTKDNLLVKIERINNETVWNRVTISEMITQKTNKIDNQLTANDGLDFRFGKDPNGSDYGYYDKNGTFRPFKTTHTEIKTINTVGTTDMGKDHKYRYIQTNNLMNIPTATKTINSNGNGQDVLNCSKVNVYIPPYVNPQGAWKSPIVNGTKPSSIYVNAGKTYAICCVAGACNCGNDDTTGFNTGFTGANVLAYSDNVACMGEGSEWATGKLYIVRATSNVITWNAGNRTIQSRAFLAIQLD